MNESRRFTEETMGELIRVDFRNKSVNIDPEEESIYTDSQMLECGDWQIKVGGESGERLTIRVIDSGPIVVICGSVIWLGVAMRAYQRIWPGEGEDLFGPLVCKTEAEQEAAFACGFVEREGLWWRDAEESWPDGMIEEALEVENAFREEGFTV